MDPLSCNYNFLSWDSLCERLFVSPTNLNFFLTTLIYAMSVENHSLLHEYFAAIDRNWKCLLEVLTRQEVTAMLTAQIPCIATDLEAIAETRFPAYKRHKACHLLSAV